MAAANSPAEDISLIEVFGVLRLAQTPNISKPKLVTNVY